MALFPGVPKLTALYNILQHFVSFTPLYDGYMHVYRNMLDSWEWNTCLEQLEHQRQDGLYKSLQVLVAGDTMQNLQQHLPQVLI